MNMRLALKRVFTLKRVMITPAVVAIAAAIAAPHTSNISATRPLRIFCSGLPWLKWA